MKSSTTQNISELLRHSSLARIIHQANTINLLNLKIQNLMPNHYRGLYRVQNLSDNSIIFEVQNATVRQGLLFQQVLLLRLIQQDYPDVTELIFKVNPNFKSPSQ